MTKGEKKKGKKREQKSKNAYYEGVYIIFKSLERLIIIVIIIVDKI